jgi:hypothetical protein
MRIHPLNLLIALLVSGLLTFGLATAEANTIKGTLAVGSFLMLATTLGTALGVQLDSQRVGVSLRVLSSAYFLAGLVLQLVFCFGQFSQVSYVVTNGVAFLSFLLFANMVYGARH